MTGLKPVMDFFCLVDVNYMNLLVVLIIFIRGLNHIYSWS